MTYLDHNATTPLGKSARQWIQDAIEYWGNPSSIHAVGRKALELLEKARHVVAESVGSAAHEVVFTSGGSEANSSAVWGVALGTAGRVLLSPVEHSSVRDCAEFLKNQGRSVERIRLDGAGQIDLNHLEDALRAGKVNLVCVMAANNETGIIHPTIQASELCHRYGAVFHCDAVQGLSKLQPKHWARADTVSVSAHKVNGPKGIGALVIRGERKLMATHFGGSQELKRRGGTQNVLGAAGFAGALSEPVTHDDLQRMESLRNHFEMQLTRDLDEVMVQGKDLSRLPNTSNVRIRGIRAELLLQALDLDGVCISAGSACSSGSLKPSEVLVAMGMSTEDAKECFRVSLGRETVASDVQSLIDRLVFHCRRIRERRSRS